MNVACWASRRRALAERARRTRVARMTGSDAEVIVAMKRERYRVSGENAAISERRAATSDLESPSTGFRFSGPSPRHLKCAGRKGCAIYDHVDGVLPRLRLPRCVNSE